MPYPEMAQELVFFLPENAIESVLNQTYQNWEMIIIDDGSTDNTAELILNYVKNDNRIQFHFRSKESQCFHNPVTQITI